MLLSGFFNTKLLLLLSMVSCQNIPCYTLVEYVLYNTEKYVFLPFCSKLILQPFYQHYQPIITLTERRLVIWRPLGQIINSKITTGSEKSAHFYLKSPKTLELWITTFLGKSSYSQSSAVVVHFRARSTFSVPVCTVSPRRWVNKALNRTSQCIASASRLTRSDFRLNLLLLKGQGSIVVNIFNNSVLRQL